MSSRIKGFYEFGPFCLNPAEQTLLREGRPIPLRPKVFDILVVLIENHGHLVEKEKLMNSVWTEQFVEEGNLNKNISMLRRVLAEGDSGHKYIETVPKRGYRFVADVREVNDHEESDLVLDADEQRSSDSQKPVARRRKASRWLVAGIPPMATRASPSPNRRIFRPSPSGRSPGTTCSRWTCDLQSTTKVWARP